MMLNETEQRLVDYLKHNAYGKVNAVRSKQIIRDLGIPGRDLRNLKGHIVLEHGIQIGSTGKGYFFASNDLEIMNFRSEYHSRGIACFSMSKSYEEMVAHKDQMSML